MAVRSDHAPEIAVHRGGQSVASASVQQLFGSQTNSGKSTNIRDLALRYDGSVNSLKWPSLNREEEPYLTTR